MSEWLDISKAPKDGTIVSILHTNGNETISGGAIYRNGNWFFLNGKLAFPRKFKFLYFPLSKN